MHCCQNFKITLNMMCVHASMIRAMMGRDTVSKGQGNARGSREGRLPVGKHPPRLSVQLKRVLCVNRRL